MFPILFHTFGVALVSYSSDNIFLYTTFFVCLIYDDATYTATYTLLLFVVQGS